MKIAKSELEYLREEVKNCHRIIKDLQKKRDFVGLTDEDMGQWVEEEHDVLRWAETKLKEKNGYTEENT